MLDIVEILEYKQERGNPESLYAVSIIKNDNIVKHFPREKLRIF